MFVGRHPVPICFSSLQSNASLVNAKVATITKPSFAANLSRRSERASRMAVTILAILAFVLFVGSPAYAQTTGLGTISGTITDASGAVIPAAQVTITNTDTNVSHSGTTNQTGYYEVDALNPGPYKVSVTMPGFEQLLRQGITLEANAVVNLPLKLSVGRSLETVVVNADASLLNTESGSSGQVLTTKQLESLPVTGSNPAWFLELAPGVQAPFGQTASQDGTLNWNGPSHFGANGVIGVNEYSLDGAPNMEGRANGINPTIEELGEMKADITGFDASVGHTMGVSITQTTKAGTNDLHGAIRTSYQNKRWSSLNHFQRDNYRHQQAIDGCVDGPSTSTQCYLDENNYAFPGTHEILGQASVGGPVFIPKLFDGRNKLFFFVSITEDLFNGTGSGQTTIPTLSERTGNFSDLPQQTTDVPQAYIDACGNTPYYGQYQIYNPYSTVLNANGIPQRAPFCGNIIPSNLISDTAMVSLYNSFLPTPTSGSVTGNNFTYTTGNPQTYRTYTGRGDYAISQRDHLFVRYTRADYTATGNSPLVGNVGIQEGPRWIDVAAIGWNHVFSARTNLDFTIGGTNFVTHCCFYPGYDQYTPGSVGLPSYTTDYAGNTSTLPILNVSNYQQIGQIDSAVNTFRTVAFRANVTHVQGRHTVRAGGEFRFQNTSQPIQGNTSGTYTFDDTYTQQNNGSIGPYTQSNTGLAYAAFLLGVQTSASVSQQAAYSISTPYYAFYAGDTWRVTPKLTVIPGIRFEYEYGPVEKHNEQIVGWDPNAQLPIAAAANTAYAATYASATREQQAALPASLTVQGGPIYAGVNGAPRNEWNNSYRILPRLAITYQLRPDTVVRAGYGLFFDTLNAGSPALDQDGFSTSTTSPSSTTFGTNFNSNAPPISDPFPVTNGSRFVPPVGSSLGAMYYVGNGATIYDHNLVPARQQRGNVSIQHQFGSATVVEVAWVGALTTGLTEGKGYTYAPASFYSGGTQPNIASNTLLGSQVPNPFYISNFSSLATSDPTAYNQIAHTGLFMSQYVSLSNLVHAYPQMSGLTINKSIGESKFQEIQVNASRRFHKGLTFMGAVQFNRQDDRDYFANAFDPAPSWESSNTSTPVRVTAEGVYDLPFGRGQTWATSGWESALLGGWQFSGSYEAATGYLVNFGNSFYIGDIKASAIKIKHPTYHNDLATGGSDYVQWLNPTFATATLQPANPVSGETYTCSYSGTGFVSNSDCQPNGYNLRVFPTRVKGVREMGLNGANANVQRNFHIVERLSLETRFEVYNLFNHNVLSSPNSSPTSNQYGWVTSDGFPNANGRWLNVSGRLRF